jgi:aspartyl-tRNA(Asn)/glutamyl-tRNA(Gln) amidotransferase subunit A
MKRLLAGTYALSAKYVKLHSNQASGLQSSRPSEFNNTYLKALYLRSQLRREFANTFRIPHPARPPRDAPTDGVDLILHPTAIRTAPVLGIPAEDRNEKSGYLQDLSTVPASLAGIPAMSIPAGRWKDGWPVGVSLTGQWGTEELLFYAGRAIEDWARGVEE